MPDSRPPLPRWTVPVVAVAVLLVSAAALVALWVWIDSLRFADVDKRATAHLEAVKVASAIAVGGGGLFALYLAARRQRTQELELELRREELQGRDLDAAERRVTELYTKAADQLGSDKAPVRLAGMYALDRLANDNPEHRQTVIDVVCAYLRMPHPADDSKPEVKAEEHEVRLAAQRMLAVRARPDADQETGTPRNSRCWPEPFELDLTGATLIDLDLSGCRLGRVSFAKATFVGRTTFSEAEFTEDARFDLATLTGDIDFTEVVFQRATWFTQAVFAGLVEFERTRFRSTADFLQIRCSGEVDFAGVRFERGADFNGAEFVGTCGFMHTSFLARPDFNEAAFGTDVSFFGARFDGGASFEYVRFDCAADFSQARVSRDINLDGSAVSRRVSANLEKTSVWPDGWRLGAAGGDGEWNELVRC